MNAKALFLLILVTGCATHENHYPAPRPYVKRELILSDFTGVTEDEKREMGLLKPRPKLAPKGAPFDISRYDGSHEDVQRCIIDLTTSSEPIKNIDICYETVPSAKLRETFRLYDNRHYIPKTVRIMNE